MIRPLRRAHRRIVVVLLVLVPAVLLAALLLRHDLPVQMEWPFQ
jgi:hypothetical protein